MSEPLFEVYVVRIVPHDPWPAETKLPVPRTRQEVDALLAKGWVLRLRPTSAEIPTVRLALADTMYKLLTGAR